MLLGVAVPTAAAALFEALILLNSKAPPSPAQAFGRVALMALAAGVFSVLMFTLIGRNRRAMAEQRQKFDDLFEGSPDALLLVNAHRQVVASNPEAFRLLGYPRQPLLFPLCRLCVLPESTTCPGDCPLLRSSRDPHFRTTVRTANGQLLAVAASVTELPGGESLFRFSDLTLVESREEARLTRLLALKALEATEEERRRLARELHDGIGQGLYALRLSATRGQPVDEMAAQLMEEVDRMAKTLWPPVLEKLGLRKALESTFAAHGNVELRVAQEFPRLSPALEGTLYRIAQEAVGNALKHGKPERVEVCLTQSKAEVVLTITDDGLGFEEEVAMERLSLGLLGMRERAQLVDGVCSIVSRIGEGTKVEVQLPREVRT